jgi:6-phosphogluconolactonase
LLERLLVAPTVRAIETTLPAAAAAAAYDAALRDVLLDVVLLGLGSDGHTASLFPDAPSLDVADRLAVPAAPALEPFVDRVTLTIPALTAASHVVFLAVGADKAEAARRAFGEPPSRTTPASLVRSREGRTTVILDAAAAAGLAAAAR